MPGNVTLIDSLDHTGLYTAGIGTAHPRADLGSHRLVYTAELLGGVWGPIFYQLRRTNTNQIVGSTTILVGTPFSLLFRLSTLLTLIAVMIVLWTSLHLSRLTYFHSTQIEDHLREEQELGSVCRKS